MSYVPFILFGGTPILEDWSTKRRWQMFGEKHQKGRRPWKPRQKEVSRRIMSNTLQRSNVKGLKDAHSLLQLTF